MAKEILEVEISNNEVVVKGGEEKLSLWQRTKKFFSDVNSETPIGSFVAGSVVDQFTDNAYSIYKMKVEIDEEQLVYAEQHSNLSTEALNARGLIKNSSKLLIKKGIKDSYMSTIEEPQFQEVGGFGALSYVSDSFSLPNKSSLGIMTYEYAIDKIADTGSELLSEKFTNAAIKKMFPNEHFEEANYVLMNDGTVLRVYRSEVTVAVDKKLQELFNPEETSNSEKMCLINDGFDINKALNGDNKNVSIKVRNFDNEEVMEILNVKQSDDGMINVNSNQLKQQEILESIEPILKSNVKLNISGSDGEVDGVVLKSETIEQINGRLTNHKIVPVDDGFSLGGSLVFIKDKTIELVDNTKARLSDISEMLDKAQKAVEDFNGFAGFVTKPFLDGKNLVSMTKDIVKSIADGEDIEDVIKDIAIDEYIVKPLREKGADYTANLMEKFDLNLTLQDRDLLKKFSDGDLQILPDNLIDKITKTEFLKAGMNALTTYSITCIVNGKDMGSEDYAKAALNIGVSNLIGAGANVLTGAAVDTMAQNVAGETTKQISDLLKNFSLDTIKDNVSVSKIKDYLIGGQTNAQAASMGIGAGITHIAMAGIADIFADDSMNSHQWQSTICMGAAIGVATYIGAFFGGPLGAAIASYAVGAVYSGKVYEEGEFPDPYDFLKIVAKEDGLGNIIYALEEGAVAIAEDDRDHDINGSDGDDSLVGKGGRNKILGRGGNDHIEGRGSDDIIFGGEGHDQIEAGSGDDKVFGEAGNDFIKAEAGNDTVFGGAGDDTILGGDGDDQIQADGEPGEDTPSGEGNDYVDGGAGNDTVLGGKGEDILVGGKGDDSILGEIGDDILSGDEGNDLLDGGDGDDIILGGAGSDDLTGGLGHDELIGGEGTDILRGDSGDDIIDGGADSDLVFGGISNDVIYGNDGDDHLYGEIGNDYVLGGAGDDKIDGYDGDDVLMGGKGNDTITAGLGNDTIIFVAGDGEDVIGGAGDNDVVDASDRDGNDVLKLIDIDIDAVSFDYEEGSDSLFITISDSEGGETGDKITIKGQMNGLEATGGVVDKVEFDDGSVIDLSQLRFEGEEVICPIGNYSNTDTTVQAEFAQAYEDNFKNMENEEINPDSSYYETNYDTEANQEWGDEYYNAIQWRSRKKKRSCFGGHYTVWYQYKEQNLDGTEGNDRIVGNYWWENINGGEGDDQLYGNGGNDIVYGGSGDDYISGGAGDDKLDGGFGHDKLIGGTGNDTIKGGYGNDFLDGQQGNDVMDGGANDDNLVGGSGNDKIDGGSGHDIIDGVDGADNITGGSGNDFVKGGTGNDAINGGTGNDTLIGHEGDDIITDEAGHDTIYAREGDDSIKAGAGDDYVSGGSGDDVICGQDGYDELYGDGGADKIEGGRGDDSIFGGADKDTLKGQEGNDTISGGAGNDWIEGGIGNDTIRGDSGADIIYAGEGNDSIDGGFDSDEIYGGDGNDIIKGGAGDDIINDGVGSDRISGGAGRDLFILTREDDHDVDTIEDFNYQEDRIVLKVSYKDPITLGKLKQLMTQDGDDINLTLGNGKQVIIKNAQIGRLSDANFAIAMSGGEDNDVLFGTEGDDVLFGGNGDDELYGGKGDDELWGNLGADRLYGEEGDDLLMYSVDGRYEGETKKSLVGYSEDSINGNWGGFLFDPTGHYGFEEYLVSRSYHGTKRGFYLEFSFPEDSERKYYKDYDLSFKHDDSAKNSYRWAYSPCHGVYAGETGGYVSNYGPSIKKWGAIQEYRNYDYKHYYTKNFYNNEQLIIDGYNYTLDTFDGGEGNDTLLMTAGDDFLALDGNSNLDTASTEARLKDVNVIHAGDGNDIVNLSTNRFNYTEELTIYGGQGDDRIWSSEGGDTVYGQEGNDDLWGGQGEDTISGGIGDDYINGWAGDDTLEGNSGNDTIDGGLGNDTIYGGAGDDIITEKEYTLRDSLGNWNQLTNQSAYNIDAVDLFNNGKYIIHANFSDGFKYFSYDKNISDGSWLHATPSNYREIEFVNFNSDERLESLISFNGAFYLSDSEGWHQLTSKTVESFKIADIDGNGEKDIVLDLGSSGVWLYKNNNNLSQLATGNPEKLYIGDFDGDGSDDIFGDYGNSGAWTYSEKGGWKHTSSGNAESLQVIDFDSDGKDDVLGDFGNGGVWLYKNDIGWEKLTSGNSHSLQVHDMNGDGKSDILGDFGDGVYIYDQVTKIWNRLTSESAYTLSRIDLDNDGDLDIVGSFPSGLYMYTPENSWEHLGASAPLGTEVIDFDGNGKVNLISNFNNGLFLYEYGLGWSQLTTETTKSFQMYDFNGDGKLDILGNFGSGVSIYDQNTGNWNKLTSETAKSLRLLDLDNDGDLDILGNFGSGVYTMITKGGSGSNDNLYGGTGNDIIEGGSGDDYIDGGEDNDTLSGGTGNDELFGGSGDDVLNGDEGNDILNGGEGNDLLRGSEGNDTLTGAAGSDVFSIGKIANDTDIIKDFKLGVDKIELDYSNAISFNYIKEMSTQDGNNLIINLQDNQKVILESVDIDDLTVDDFVFRGESSKSSDLEATIANTRLYNNLIFYGNSAYYLNTDRASWWDSEKYAVAVGGHLIAINDASENAFAATISQNQNTWIGLTDYEQEGVWKWTTGESFDYNNFLSGQPDNRYDEDYVQFWAGTNGGWNDNDYWNGCWSIVEIDNYNIDRTIDASSGNDKIYGLGTNDEIHAGAGNDTVHANDGDDLVYGGDGNDTIYTEDGNDKVYGGNGDDFIASHAGDDILYGNEGNDEIHGDYGNDIIDGGSGNDKLYGGSDEDVIAGGSGNDTIYGGDGVDIISGGEGNDFIRGGLGSDTIDGGAGDDVIEVGNYNYNNDSTYRNGSFYYLNQQKMTWWDAENYAQSLGGHLVTINNAEENQFIVNNFNGSNIFIGLTDYEQEGVYVWSSGEELTFSNWNPSDPNNWYNEDYVAMWDSYSGRWADTHNDRDGGLQSLIEIKADTTSNTVHGGEGDDTIKGAFGNDILNGDSGNDTIYGGHGDDTISGGIGSDILDGGAGNDTLSYENSEYDVEINLSDNSVAVSNSDIDTISNFENVIAGHGDDFIFGDSDKNNIQGGAGDDYIKAGAGDDYLIGGAGADIIDGGAGNDVASYYTSSEAVEVDLESGIGKHGDAEGDVISNVERLNGSYHDDILLGSSQNDEIRGLKGNDTIYGRDGDDTLYGGSVGTEDGGGNNKIYGGSGNDTIYSDYGNDFLDGGSGDDTYYLLDGFGHDVISEVEGGYDKIVLPDSVSINDVSIAKEGNDLVIKVLNGDNSLNVKDFFVNSENRIESLSISGEVFDLSALRGDVEKDSFYSITSNVITQEDSSAIIDLLPVIDESGKLIVITKIEEVDAGNGNVEILEDKRISYIPNSDFYGSDIITYVVKDDNGNIVSKEINISVTNVNDTPVVELVDVEVEEDNSIIIDVLDKASDVDDDILVIDSVSDGANGSASVVLDNDGNQVIQYTPDENFNGTDTVSYTISDGKGGVVTTTATVKVNSVNDEVVINNDLLIERGISYTNGVSKPIYFKVGDEINLDLSNLFSDADVESGFGSDVLSYSLKMASGSNVPSWLSLDLESMSLKGVVPSNVTLSELKKLNDSDLVLKVSDRYGSSKEVGFDLSIDPETVSIIKSGNDGDNTVTGLKGDDILTGNLGHDNIIGGEGDDILYGNKSYDTSNPSGFNNIKYNEKSIQNILVDDSAKSLSGDFNGDGKVDSVQIGSVRVGGFNFFGANIGGDDMVVADVKLSGANESSKWINGDSGMYWNEQKWLTGDFNGDGRDDLVNIFEDEGGASADVKLSTGEGFVSERWMTKSGGFWDSQKWLVGDFNGDGKDDLANIFDDDGRVSIDVKLSSDSVGNDDKMDSFVWERWATKTEAFDDNIVWSVEDYDKDGINELVSGYSSDNAGNVTIYENDSFDDDALYGNEGNDILKGAHGNDLLEGGLGADNLFGGEGYDIFSFTNLEDSKINTSDLNNESVMYSNIDIINDFEQGIDKIDLRALGFDGIVNGDGYVVDDNNDGIIEYNDTNILGYHHDDLGNTIIEDSNSDFAIKLIGEFDLTDDDLLVG